MNIVVPEPVLFFLLDFLNTGLGFGAVTLVGGMGLLLIG